MPLPLRLVLSATAVGFVAGHARWKCPEPRDLYNAQGHREAFINTANKGGPCGDFSGKENWGRGAVAVLQPGWQTLVWEEAVSHQGSPFRIALLDEHEEVAAVLLNHIPHWDASKPTRRKEETYVPYRMTVEIPDVHCEKCSLQLLYVMTDKVRKPPCNMTTCTYYAKDSDCNGRVDASLPSCFDPHSNKTCVRENTCYNNYHSCADVSINGTVPLAANTTTKISQPKDWPFVALPDLDFTEEKAEWVDGWLSHPGLPQRFAALSGKDLCPAVDLNGTANATAATRHAAGKPAGLRRLKRRAM